MATMKGLEVIIYVYLLGSHYFMFGMCTINYSCAQLIMNEEMVLLVVMQLQTETNEDREVDFSRIPLLSTSAFVSVCYE